MQEYLIKELVTQANTSAKKASKALELEAAHFPSALEFLISGLNRNDWVDLRCSLFQYQDKLKFFFSKGFRNKPEIYTLLRRGLSQDQILLALQSRLLQKQAQSQTNSFLHKLPLFMKQLKLDQRSCLKLLIRTQGNLEQARQAINNNRIRFPKLKQKQMVDLQKSIQQVKAKGFQRFHSTTIEKLLIRYEGSIKLVVGHLQKRLAFTKNKMNVCKTLTGPAFQEIRYNMLMPEEYEQRYNLIIDAFNVINAEEQLRKQFNSGEKASSLALAKLHSLLLGLSTDNYSTTLVIDRLANPLLFQTYSDKLADLCKINGKIDIRIAPDQRTADQLIEQVNAKSKDVLLVTSDCDLIQLCVKENPRTEIMGSKCFVETMQTELGRFYKRVTGTLLSQLQK